MSSQLVIEERRGDEWKETALEGRKTIASLIESNEIVKDFFKKVPVVTRPEDNGPRKGRTS